MRSFILSLSVFALLSIAGCPRENEEPPDAARPDRDAALDAARVLDGGPDAATAEPDAFVENDAFGPDTNVDAFSTAPDAFSCTAPEGCFRCPATTSLELLNQCTTASCQPFVNDTTRLPLLRADGSLPPLP